MRKFLLITALLLTATSIFVQYRSVSFAMGIVDLIREFGKVLAEGDQTTNVRDFFFYQADEIRIYAQDSFLAQQISMGLLAVSICLIIIALLMEKPMAQTLPEETAEPEPAPKAET